MFSLYDMIKETCDRCKHLEKKGGASVIFQLLQTILLLYLWSKTFRKGGRKRENTKKESRRKDWGGEELDFVVRRNWGNPTFKNDKSEMSLAGKNCIRWWGEIGGSPRKVSRGVVTIGGEKLKSEMIGARGRMNKIVSKGDAGERPRRWERR